MTPERFKQILRDGDQKLRGHPWLVGLEMRDCAHALIEASLVRDDIIEDAIRRLPHADPGSTAVHGD